MADKESVVTEIVGHHEVRRQLAENLSAGSAAHAYLFSGPSGIGKAAVALEFARLILCDNDQLSPCESCLQCSLSRTLQHPDMDLIFALPPSKRPSSDKDYDPTDDFPDQIAAIKEQLSRDPYRSTTVGATIEKDSTSPQKSKLKGNEIKVGQMRGLLRRFSRRAFQARRKVAVIFQADLMTDQSQNTLLKLLEEPPFGSYLLLVSDDERGLLPTIRSRCRIQHLVPLDRRIVSDSLQNLGVESATAEIATALSAGSYSRARSLSKQNLPELQESVVNFMAESAKCNPLTLMETVESIIDDLSGSDFSYFEFLSFFLRDAAFYSQSEGQSPDLTFQSLHQRISRLASSYPEADFPEALKAVDTATTYLSNGYTPQLVITSLAINIHRALGPRARIS